MHIYFLQKASIMDCHTVLLEILNLLQIRTLDNYGFLSFSVNNFINDPFAIYSGNVNPIIYLLHPFSWTDPSVRFYLKATYPCWSCTFEKKKYPHTFLSTFLSVKLTLLSTHCKPHQMPLTSQDLHCRDPFIPYLVTNI